MIRTTLILNFVLLSAYVGFAQVTNISAKQLKTSKYAGLYSYGKNVEKERVGTIIIYPDTDSTVLFYFESNTGPAAFGMGEYYGRVKVLNGIGLFYTKPTNSGKGCHWRFTFSKKKVVIQTLNEENNCGFAAGVAADGNYGRQIKGIIEECLDIHGEAINFGALKPENYTRK
jgi:hypothetical protein